MTTVPKPLRPRKTPRQKRSEETREQILRAAARVFAEHGYAAGTTNRIAEAAGLSIGSLYQYFPNKDAILLLLARRHVDEGRAAVAAAVAAGLPADRRECVAVLVDTALRAHGGDPRLHQVLFEESPRPPALLAEIRALQDDLVGLVAGLLVADGGLGAANPRLTAWFLVATAESLTHRYLADRPTADPRAFRDELIRLLTGYVEAG
ncbi:TetR/AcrR family transcriptional regulator [Nonomuraea sp. NN258]|uniref:TetR/AcrR family transcriptional regulator n=1 Tax=Nonomuraea antri TaxID=2730852 RepID=UPI001567E3D2|nr:TetR/AcrR family transcriptional regulator [Nonomuraea antri]NRQ40822.1 TetR/AcrR family transcriptional regulator [Nonomuraea antri]